MLTSGSRDCTLRRNPERAEAFSGVVGVMRFVLFLQSE